MQASTQDPSGEKFQKDLAELETLKQKAKTVKPKSVGSFLFQNLIITLLLLFILFVIGFLFSYYNAKKKYNLETANFTPQAQINFSEGSDSDKCNPATSTSVNPNGTLSKTCTEAKTKEACEGVDIYNEAGSNFDTPDGKPDCIWNN